VALFGLAVIGIVLAVYLVIIGIFFSQSQPLPPDAQIGESAFT